MSSLQFGRRRPERRAVSVSYQGAAARAAHSQERLGCTWTGVRGFGGARDSALQPVKMCSSMPGGAAAAACNPQSWCQSGAGASSFGTASRSAPQPAGSGSCMPGGTTAAEHDARERAEPGVARRTAGGGAAERVVMYKGFGMVPFRVLVRLKVIQLTGAAGLAIPITCFLAGVRPVCPNPPGV